jgi:putative oxidoreductase
MILVRKIVEKIPEFCFSHWLFRVPLAIIFFQQGSSKFPLTLVGAESYDLPYLVWWFVAYGELGGGIGLLAGGLLANSKLVPWFGDLITRFSGITVCCIMTGVIWTGQPESLMDVMLYDNLHIMLWVGGLFFALRGNRS